MRLIDADKMIVYFKLWASNVKRVLPQELAEICVTLYAEIIKEIAKQPTLDTESLRQKGEWVGEADGYADGELVYDVWYYSECNYDIDTDDPDLLFKFCPNCGADMRGESE